MITEESISLTWPNIKIEELPVFKPKLDLAVMASGKGSNFEALIKSIERSQLQASINCLLVNNETCGSIAIAEKYNVPYEIINHKQYSSREKFDFEILRILDTYNIEGIVMAGWMRIVTPVLIDKYKNRIVNIHPSLLPSFRGINAVNQAVEMNVKISGCTVHLVTEAVDSGKILIQAAVPLLEGESQYSLTKRIQSEEHKILPIGVALAAKVWREF